MSKNTPTQPPRETQPGVADFDKHFRPTAKGITDTRAPTNGFGDNPGANPVTGIELDTPRPAPTGTPWATKPEKPS